jgi:hypothetical protein
MKKYDMHVHIWKGKEERDMEAMAKASELYGSAESPILRDFTAL